METRKLGNSDMHITPVGFGSWAVGGGKWAYGWGSQEDRDSIAAIHKALDSGVNWIDTAAVYGLGHSEEVVARALEGRSGDRPYIFTKCSMVWDDNGEVGHSLKAASVRKECEDSLRRLKVDAIDLYQVHWPNPDEEIEEGWTEMARLQQEGKVRWIGVSNFSADQMKRAQAIAPVTSNQPPYSMLRRGVEDEVLPFCEQNGIGVIVYSPMLSGMLSGGMTKERAQTLPENDWRSRNKEFNEPRLSKNLELVEKLREIGKRHNAGPGVMAISWVLRNPAVTGAIVGGRTPQQVEEWAKAGTLRLDPDEIAAIDEAVRVNAQE